MAEFTAVEIEPREDLMKFSLRVDSEVQQLTLFRHEIPEDLL